VQHKLFAASKKPKSKARPLPWEKLGCQVQAFSHFVSLAFSMNLVGGNLPFITAHLPHLASTLIAGDWGALQRLQ
jgi:hypothetical protein